MIKLGQRLKKLRHEFNLSQKELSLLTKIPKSTISAYELNKFCPQGSKIYILCKFFKVSADYLLGLKDE